MEDQFDRAEEGAPRRVVRARLLADTLDSERRLGFRNVGASERRLLYQAPDGYVEIRLPPPAAPVRDEEDDWLYGQYVVTKPERAAEPQPAQVRLRNKAGTVAVVHASDILEFAVPFRGDGPFSLDFERDAESVVRLEWE